MIDHISQSSTPLELAGSARGAFFGPSDDEPSSVAAIGILFPMANIFARVAGSRKSSTVVPDANWGEE
jgi:hypothetical protein